MVLRCALGAMLRGSKTASSTRIREKRSSRASSVTGNIRFMGTLLDVDFVSGSLAAALPAEYRRHGTGRIDARDKSGEPLVDEEVRAAELVGRVQDDRRICPGQLGHRRPDADPCIGLQS